MISLKAFVLTQSFINITLWYNWFMQTKINKHLLQQVQQVQQDYDSIQASTQAYREAAIQSYQDAVPISNLNRANLEKFQWKRTVK